MNCEQVEEQLSAYLDNMLATEVRQDVATHLQTCSRCSTILADYTYFDGLLSRLPRAVPSQHLRDTIFAAPEYQELMAALNPHSTHPSINAAYHETEKHPPLEIFRDTRPMASARPYIPEQPQQTVPIPATRQRRRRRLLMMQIAAAAILLVLLAGGLIGRNLWQRQPATANTLTAITPPAGPQQGGPLPAGVRFVFLRAGALWSAPDDGTAPASRLTSPGITVATHWTVSPPDTGRSAGNMLAYIDLRQAYVHTIRSDGQLDTRIQQPLLKGVPSAKDWNSATGTTILNSLAWSKNGARLAFVADPDGTDNTRLYIASTDAASIQAVSIPGGGSVSRPVWSPDGIRLAFAVTYKGQISVLDYNTQNHSFLTINNAISQANAPSSLLTLDWSADAVAPAITWSLGTIGHVSSVWMRHVGVGVTEAPQLLARGNYAQAIYSRSGHNSLGSWLLVSSIAGRTADLWRVDVVSQSRLVPLTRGMQIGFAHWSPDGLQIAYLEALSSGTGALHIINVATNNDIRIASSAAINPEPAWSADSRQLAYRVGGQTMIAATQNRTSARALPLRGAPSSFAWSVGSPQQLIITLGNSQGGRYLVDTLHNTSMQIDTLANDGPISWTEIP